MAKPKKKLSKAQKAEKARKKQLFMTVFRNGKQVRIRRPSTIDGLSPEEFIRRNADMIWLHQNEEWELLYEMEQERDTGEPLDGEQL